ncbi:uncharacterized protein B0I36DRAFT_369018 [Microdochium trichocladiopsis]|uniref:LysM domain-containing protein n=1 Tax=Microdochium trichocladiopsis TaxID=1682393 RepID=A0A9P8XVN2_9PEZI|nr:uncharacterized protein B0I36DRAFT_369018 [Microdochium trichocladiopsis]KAH7016497.1 hypothetical protein B0I36DRAFT_369018 [Microdochium trichocladiopsis]
MRSTVLSLLAACLPVAWAGPVAARQAFEVDPNTTKYCTWYHDVIEGDTCEFILASWEISLETFMRWNPSITAGCGNVQVNHSYCIEAIGEPAQASTTTTSKPPAATATAPPTTTKPSTTAAPTQPPTPGTSTGANGVATPLPVRAGMTTNCRRFYKVQPGDTCDAIIAAAGIYGPNFYIWNPEVKEDCSGLWAGYYCCLQNVAGPSITLTPAVPSTTTAPPPTTPTGNGVTTPLPIQSGMTTNCRRFYKVQPGDTCDAIIAASGIYGPNFYIWNPAARSDCSGLWANTFCCIGNTVGPSITLRPPTPTTTTKPPAGNGVATPTPFQVGMVSNCKSFYLVRSGDTCSSIASARGISVNNFIRWNPAVGAGCTGMWANTWACVGLI